MLFSHNYRSMYSVHYDDDTPFYQCTEKNSRVWYADDSKPSEGTSADVFDRILLL